MAKTAPEAETENEAVAAGPSTRSIIIQGISFSVSLPYSAGHVLSDAEARALNQVRCENLRNNFAPKVKASVAGEEGALAEADLAPAFAETDAAYSFSMPGEGGGSRTLDPIEREARALAKEWVKGKLAEAVPPRSLTPPKDATDEEKKAYKAQIDAKIDEVAQREPFLILARKNVEARKANLDALGDDLAL